MNQAKKTIDVGRVKIGAGQPLAIIAGPCVMESYDQCVQIGSAVRDRCAALGFGYIFKGSFDKANRSSIGSPRGLGIDEGLRVMEKVKAELGVPVTTDVHESDQPKRIAPVIDLLQVPAFLCRQTDLLVACAETQKTVNVKKGQFLSPAEMDNVINKLIESGAGETDGGIMLTERGTFFGYNRLVNDFVGVGDMVAGEWPVCFDVTHSTQQPGGQGNASGGRPERAPLLARCAVAAGVHALFIETHPDPKSALSDGATMLPLDQTLPLLGDLQRLHQVMGSMCCD
ncbi:3-deoxy-8-phosphooctulonate synthase [Poriferisphaera sp. WC338]|uniref:3-deoxy-8-phosphooctulonate synthase n=1 Tax=Poriferisphaera sp. WC338 TaxID=3425129 RepID=UPI003D8171DD